MPPSIMSSFERLLRNGDIEAIHEATLDQAKAVARGLPNTIRCYMFNHLYAAHQWVSELSGDAGTFQYKVPIGVFNLARLPNKGEVIVEVRALVPCMQQLNTPLTIP